MNREQHSQTSSRQNRRLRPHPRRNAIRIFGRSGADSDAVGGAQQPTDGGQEKGGLPFGKSAHR